MKRLLIALALILGIGLATSARAEAPLPPAPTRWATDTVGLLKPGTTAQLDAELENYQRTSGHQVVVWIGGTIGGAALDDWAVRTFAAWKVGRQGMDDGLAVFVLATDHKIDIEVGYGLEGNVPDAIAHRVIADIMAPKLRAGDADGAVTAGVDALLTAINDGKPVNGAATTQRRHAPPAKPISLAEIIIGILVIIAFLALLVTHPAMAMWLLWSISGGGGGGGGFSGGGGRSGGGGARGGW